MKLKKKPKRILITILVLAAIVAIAFVGYNVFFGKQEVKEAKVLKTIEKYGYTLKDNKTKRYQEMFEELDKILKNGFRAGHGASRPAKRIETASIIGCISMETVQNEMHGGQAIPAFDFYLAPYVKLTFIEEIKKIEEFLEKIEK